MSFEAWTAEQFAKQSSHARALLPPTNIPHYFHSFNASGEQKHSMRNRPVRSKPAVSYAELKSDPIDDDDEPEVRTALVAAGTRPSFSDLVWSLLRIVPASLGKGATFPCTRVASLWDQLLDRGHIDKALTFVPAPPSQDYHASRKLRRELSATIYSRLSRSSTCRSTFSQR